MFNRFKQILNSQVAQLVQRTSQLQGTKAISLDEKAFDGSHTRHECHGISSFHRLSLQIIQTLAVSLLFAAVLSISLSAFAKNSNETENLCRAQAKEVAKESYKNCILESKSAQLEKLQKAYERRIQDLRSQYEGELKQLGAQKKSSLQNSQLTKNSELPKSKKGRIEIPASAEESMDIPEPITLNEE